MFIKNSWYVAGWDEEVSGGTPLARTLLNVPVMFWRDSQGQVVAFEDRCCHRGAPLSLGRQEGDCIRCMYHGLVFDRSGSCVWAPAEHAIPPQARVRTFPVVERHHWIWIWMGDPAKADESQIPDTHWLSDPGWAGQRGGHLHYSVNYLLIADNLLDFTHLAYVHAGTFTGSSSYGDVRPRIDRSDRGEGVKITRWVLDTDPPPFVSRVKPSLGKVDRWNVYDFLVPGVLIMDSGSAPVGTGAPEGIRVDANEFMSCQALTPETENSTHYFFAQVRNFELDRPEITEAHFLNLLKGFDEDKRMIEAQGKVLALDPNFKMVPLGIDAALGRFRALVNKRIAQEQAAAANALPTPAAAGGASS